MKFTKKKIIILISMSVGVLILGGLGFYLLYPKMNPEKYEETVQQVEEENALNATLNSSESESINLEETDSSDRTSSVISLQKTQIDSLQSIVSELRRQRNETNTINSDLSAENKNLKEKLDQKITFEEELKGILSLDDKQLSPILENMDEMKVADLYQGSNSTQKQKILRCLDPKRAAKLLEAVIK
jgi:flagellar motor switch protein FliG